MPQGASTLTQGGSLSLSRLTKLDPKSDQFIASLRDILYSEDYPKFIESLTADELYKFLDLLDQSLDTIPSNTDLFHKCLRALRKLSGMTGQLPSSFNIPENELVREGYHPIASGGFSDVWIGTYRRRKVALKCLKMSSGNQPQVLKALCKEVVAWRQLSHPNVLPLLGVSTIHSLWCIVSDWMESGSITDHLRAHPEDNRLSLLSEVAKGLEHLHSFEIVHGDLKGANILVDDVGSVRLADFGLNSITTDDNSFNASSINNERGTTRWMAPEILNVDDDESARPTRESDIYAFAMVVIEAFTGKVPFPNLVNTATVIRIVRGGRPSRPEEARSLGLSDSVWDMVERCWKQDPAQRPLISEVLGFFTTAASD